MTEATAAQPATSGRLEQLRAELASAVAPSTEDALAPLRAAVAALQATTADETRGGLRGFLAARRGGAAARDAALDVALTETLARLVREFDEQSRAQNRRLAQLLSVVEELASGAPAAPALPAGVQQAITASMGADHLGLPGFARVFNPYAQLRISERVLLYALVLGLKPRHCLEIGTSFGGSALIISGAMDDNGFGQLVCVDQEFRIEEEAWRLMRHRIVRVAGRTPDVLVQAGAAAPGGFDFAFLDGDHTTEGLLADIAGTLPLLADRAVLLFHDSHHAPVQEALTTALRRHAPQLQDGAELSLEQTVLEVPNWGANVWSGLRLFRFERGGV